MKNSFILIKLSRYLLAEKFVFDFTKLKDVSIQIGVTLNLVDELLCGHIFSIQSYILFILINNFQN